MRLARELGLQLHELMGWPGPMTARQFSAWRWWLDDEMNRPSRTDHYLMQVAYEVVRMSGRTMKNVDRIKLDDYRLEFGGGDERKAENDPFAPPADEFELQKRIALSKAGWASRLAGVKTVKTPPPGRDASGAGNGG